MSYAHLTTSLDLFGFRLLTNPGTECYISLNESRACITNGYTIVCVFDYDVNTDTLSFTNKWPCKIATHDRTVYIDVVNDEPL